VSPATERAARALLAAHEHNERAAAESVLARLGRGERVAYISDAGTPAVSDPGAALVAAARDAGYRVVPIPGARSVEHAQDSAASVNVQLTADDIARIDAENFDRT